MLSCGAVYFAVYKVDPTFESVDKNLSVTIQMKAIEQYFPVVLFILLCKVVLALESAHIKCLKCDNSLR